METLDPTTGAVLPLDAIQRILFIAPKTHVYNIPPLASTKGHTAAHWTTDPARHIFTARLRILETSLPSPTPETNPQGLKVDLILEDSSTGQLFAAAPYTNNSTVEAAVDSSRFFALTVRDPNGRKAILGIGFEDRSEAFDLNLALQEARKALGWEGNTADTKKKVEADKDYSLKEGETITVNLGNSGNRRRSQLSEDKAPDGPVNLQSFALAPPPGPGSAGPTAAEARKQKRLSAKDLGFDDGQFGEFA